MGKYYKGFEKDMTCRGKQYAENAEYEEPRAELCEAGMHFCENPFDVLDYYPLVNDDGELITAAEVTPLAEVKCDGKKSVTTKLRIGAKLSFGAFVKAGIDFLLDRTAVKTKNINNAKIGSSGDGAKIASRGLNSVVCCAGNNCAVKAKKGSWITLAEWKTIDGTYSPVYVKTEYVDGDRIKPDTWYKLVNGVFVEVEG